MKAKNIFFLALIAGGITTVLFYLFINETNAGMAPDPLEMQEVVAAAVDIDQHVLITEDMLVITEVPEDQLHPEMIQDASQIIDRYTTAAVKEGEIIMEHRLDTESEAAEFISTKLQEGYRAVSISVDYVKSVSNLVEPDDYVDIVLTEAVEEENSPVSTEMVLEKVRVLAVGERLMETDEEGTVQEEYHAVTLELLSEDAVDVIHASERGTLQLALYSKLLSEETEEAEGETGEQKEEEVEVEAETEPEAEENGTTFVLPVSPRAMIRTSPELEASVLTAVDEGTPLEFLGETDTDDDGRTWYMIQTPEEESGWISSRIVTLQDEGGN